MDTNILLESGTNELEILEFKVSGNYYGINVAKVKEIMKYQSLTPIPNGHPNLEGAFNTRGETISIINLAKCLGMKEENDPDKDMFLLTGFNNLSSGTKYSFAIKAYTVLNDSSRVYSAEYPVLNTFTRPAKVSGFAKKSVGKTSVSTTWKSTKGATGYRMYIYKNKKWTQVATVKGTSYTFKNLKRHTKYNFAVIAYKTVDKKTAAASSYPTITVTTK